MQLKILLIMPYFERPNMVLNALRSFEKINYENYEICIIDDGSVNHPIENIISKNNIKINNLKILNTNDTIENKKNRGSIHGKFMNQAIRESDAEIIAMMSDDDALYEDYFSNLNKFYNLNPDIKYSYAHVIPFDPFTQIPCRSLNIINSGKKWNTSATSGLNWTQPINPFCKVDATQVSWRSECSKQHNVWLPEEQTKNLDATFYKEMFENFNYCHFNGCTSVYKGLHQDQLSNRTGLDQYVPSDSYEKTNYISVCSNFKNESKYLKEWLDYHIDLGVEHFYLYDDNSTDDYEKILEPYEEAGFVTLKKVDQSNIAVKPLVFSDFMKNHKFQNYWVAFIDVDEFITIKENKKIKEFLIDFESYPAIGLNWLMFGSSGLEKNDSNRVLDVFTKCNDPYDHEHNNVSCHIKSIVNPRKAIGHYINPHFCIYDTILSYPTPGLAVDTDKQPILGNNVKVGGEKYFFAATDSPKFDKAFVRHYWSKSRKEFFDRRSDSIKDDTGQKRYKKQDECEEEFNTMNIHYNKLDYVKFIGEKNEII